MARQQRSMFLPFSWIASLKLGMFFSSQPIQCPTTFQRQLISNSQHLQPHLFRSQQHPTHNRQLCFHCQSGQTNQSQLPPSQQGSRPHQSYLFPIRASYHPSCLLGSMDPHRDTRPFLTGLFASNPLVILFIFRNKIEKMV